MTDELRTAVAAAFLEVNGTHPMTADDDAYVDKHFVTLDALCARRGADPDAVRGDMLAGRLPLPSYLRSDGTEMVPPDLFALADAAGGIEVLPGWFRAHWADRERADAEWADYLRGHYVCLRDVAPAAMRRKDDIVAELKSRLAAPRPDLPEWLADVRRLVDELDELELPFTDYDRLRFGGPVSRDIYIDAIRGRFDLSPIGG